MLLLSILFALIVFGLLAIVVVDTIRGKGRWGINLRLPNCPECDQKAPAFRNPTSIKQALWGGWTCSNCGCEMDKWGKEVATINETKVQPKQVEQSKMEPIMTFDEKGKTPVERVFDENDN